MSRLLPLLAIAACLGGSPSDPPTWEEAVAGWTWPEPLPDLPLVDASGRSFSLHRYREDWLLVAFVFTRCVEGRACPTTMSRLVATDEAWSLAAEGRATTSLSILALTLDPDHDTPERLAAYGARYGADPARITLATGPRDLLATGLPSMFSILALPDADAVLTHTVKVTLLRPGLVYEGEWKDESFDPQAVVGRILSETPGR